MAVLWVEVGVIKYPLRLSTHDAYMQIFIEELRGTESLGVAQSKIDLIGRIVAKGGTWAEDRLDRSLAIAYGRVLI